MGESPPADREEALAELALRYVRAHGPAEPADLASWSGIRPADARSAWRAIEDRMVEVATTRGPRWALRSQNDRAPAGLVRVLPSFDEYLLGWKDRSPIASVGNWKTINRGGGWLHPVVLSDGRAMATWKTERTGDRVRVVGTSFSTPTSSLRRRVALEAKRLGSFLGKPVDGVLD